MSWNLMAAVEQEDHGNEVRAMVLVRASAGITHSATIAAGDTVAFPCGLDLDITHVVHKYQPTTSNKAPVSIGMGAFHRPLRDAEIEMLCQDGWRDMSGGD